MGRGGGGSLKEALFPPPPPPPLPPPPPPPPPPLLAAPSPSLTAVYDKGASGFVFPADAGVAVGDGTVLSRLVLQVHYLLHSSPSPTWGPDAPSAPTDASGLRLQVVRGGGRPYNTRMLGIMDVAMRLPGGVSGYHHAYEVGAETLGAMIAHDVARWGKVRVIAAHLHAHDMCVGFRLNVTRGGTSRELAEITPYYG